MKNLRSIYTGLALAAIITFAVTGCKKETVVADDSAKYEADAMISDADNDYSDASFTDGSETAEFSAENEGLPEAYTLIETDMDDAGFKRGVEKRFLTCLKKLGLSDTQVMQMRKAFRAYEECKANDIRLHREAYAKLHARVEAARKDLVAQLRNGKITKAEFEAKMKALRQDFETSLRYIKASFAKNLKLCYDKFVRNLKGILSDRQWRAFVDCYR